MKNINNFPFHPFLLAVYPVLALLSYNIDQVGVWVVWRSLLIVISAAIILTGILALVIKPFQKAAIISSFILILFFSYGQVHELLLNSKGLLFEISHHKYLGAIFLIIFVIGIYSYHPKDPSIPNDNHHIKYYFGSYINFNDHPYRQLFVQPAKR